MIAIVIGILGVIVGMLTARKRGGNRKDMAQFGFGYGAAFFLLSYLVLLILNAIFL